MAKMKTKSRRMTRVTLLVTTTTKVGNDEFRVTIKGRRRGMPFSLLAELVPPPGKGKSPPNLPISPIRWMCRVTEAQADMFVWSLALELGYDAVQPHGAPMDIPLYVLRSGRKLLYIKLYLHPKGPDAAIVVSRAGAQKILEAMAKSLDWKLTE